MLLTENPLLGKNWSKIGERVIKSLPKSDLSLAMPDTSEKFHQNPFIWRHFVYKKLSHTHRTHTHTSTSSAMLLSEMRLIINNRSCWTITDSTGINSSTFSSARILSLSTIRSWNSPTYIYYHQCTLINSSLRYSAIGCVLQTRKTMPIMSSGA